MLVVETQEQHKKSVQYSRVKIENSSIFREFKMQKKLFKFLTRLELDNWYIYNSIYSELDTFQKYPFVCSYRYLQMSKKSSMSCQFNTKCFFFTKEINFSFLRFSMSNTSTLPPSLGNRHVLRVVYVVAKTARQMATGR